MTQDVIETSLRHVTLGPRCGTGSKQPSLPGLTRQSIRFVRVNAKQMDARVKATHDVERS